MNRLHMGGLGPAVVLRCSAPILLAREEPYYAAFPILVCLVISLLPGSCSRMDVAFYTIVNGIRDCPSASRNGVSATHPIWEFFSTPSK
jgi:hypothetical protein